MIAEIVGEALLPALKFIGRVLFEGIIEGVIQGAGYLLCRPFSKKVDLDSAVVLVVGLAFWIGVGAAIYVATR